MKLTNVCDTQYETSEYIAVADEFVVEESENPDDFKYPNDFKNQTVVYNNDICTIYGDKATLSRGDLVVLNYGLEGHFSNNEWISDYDNRWSFIKICKSAMKNYNPLSNQPTDWTNNWKAYYEVVGGVFKSVVGNYDVLTEEPLDWDANWKSYYRYENDNYIKLTGNEAPTFVENTYYKNVAPPFESYQYFTKLTEPVEIWPDDPAEEHDYIEGIVDWPNDNIATYTMAQAAASLTEYQTSHDIEDTTQTGHALVLGTELATGHYKALCIDNNNIESNPTYWEILGNEASDEDIIITPQSEGVYLIENKTDYEMECIYIGTPQNNDSRVFNMHYNNVYWGCSFFEKQDNKVALQVDELINFWKATGSTSTPVAPLAVRVLLKGRYGKAASSAKLLNENEEEQ